MSIFTAQLTTTELHCLVGQETARMAHPATTPAQAMDAMRRRFRARNELSRRNEASAAFLQE